MSRAPGGPAFVPEEGTLMAIRFTCACGQTITARSDFAGRKVQCTACKKIHVVPGGSESARATQLGEDFDPGDEAPPRPAVRLEPTLEETGPLLAQPAQEPEPARPVDATGNHHFRCACGGAYQARSEHAGQPTRCPRCAEILFVPTAESVRQASGRTVLAAHDRGDRYQRTRYPDRAYAGVLVAILALLILGSGGYAYWEFYLREESEKQQKAKLEQRHERPDDQPRFPGGGFRGQQGGFPGGFRGQQGGFPGGGFRGQQGGNPIGGRPRPGREVRIVKDGEDPKARALDLIPATAVGFMSVRLGEAFTTPDVQKLLPGLPVEWQNLLQMVEPRLGTKIEDVEHFVAVQNDSGGDPYWVIVATKTDIDRRKVLDLFQLSEPITVNDPDGGKHVYYPPGERGGLALRFLNDRVVLLGPRQGMDKQLFSPRNRSREAGPLDAGLKAAAGPSHLVVAGTIPRPTLLALTGRLPKELGDPKPLLEMKSFVATTDAVNAAPLKVEAVYADAAAATAAADTLKRLLEQAQGELENDRDTPKEFKATLQDILKSVKSERKDMALLVSVKGIDPAQVIPLLNGVQRVREAAGRAAAANNLKQLALAMITYADANGGRLPPPCIFGKDGRPLYSWRVALLPYLGEEKLHAQLKLDEPFNSPQNGPLLSRMPRVFETPGADVPAGHTCFQVFFGPTTPFTPGAGTRYPAGFKDGTSNTILIVEAARPLPWAAPGEIVYSDQVSPLDQISKRAPQGALAAFADGAVKRLPPKLSEKTLRALITPAAGDEPGPDAP
jgi:hypothetical protein